MRTLLLSATLILFSCGSTSAGKDAGSGGGLPGTGGGFISSGGGSSGGGATGGGATGGGSTGGGSTAGGSTAGGSTAGGSTAGGSTAGGSSAGGASGGGSTGMAGVVCGSSASCSGATPSCCGTLNGGILGFSCQSSCPDAGAAWECDEPSDCNADAGTPYCCAVMDLGPGTFPACPAQSLSSSCRAACTTNVGLTCPTGGTARVCSHLPDCPAAQKCCAFTQGSQTIQVCVSGSLPCTGIP